MTAGLAGVVRRMNVGVVTVAVSYLFGSLEALASDLRQANLGACWQSRCLSEKDLPAFIGVMISEDEGFPRCRQWERYLMSLGTSRVTRQYYPRVFDIF